MAWVLYLFQLIESILMLCVVWDMMDCHGRIREPCLLVNDNTGTRSRCPTCVMHHCPQVGFQHSRLKRTDLRAQNPGCPSGAQNCPKNKKRMITERPFEIHHEFQEKSVNLRTLQLKLYQRTLKLIRMQDSMIFIQNIRISISKPANFLRSSKLSQKSLEPCYRKAILNPATISREKKRCSRLTN